MIRPTEIQPYHNLETLNHAIRILREECQDHIKCKECPFNINAECLLAAIPDKWKEVDEDE